MGMYLNRHDVIYIDFSSAPKRCKSYSQYITRIENGIMDDLTAVYFQGANLFCNGNLWTFDI